ncbi:MAG: hypothetical protein JNK75_03815 [Betaproteobacteria bacterium]|nr:hypothetical protein [Betaproteobacteria bacterium]
MKMIRTAWMTACAGWMVPWLALAAEPQVPDAPPAVFVAKDGTQTPLVVDAQALQRLRNLIPKRDASPQTVPLRLDCAALQRLREDLRRAKPPGWQRAAPAGGAEASRASDPNWEHQQKQTREWLSGLERRFACNVRQ